MRRTRSRRRPGWLVTVEGRAIAVAEAVLAYARRQELATGSTSGIGASLLAAGAPEPYSSGDRPEETR